MRLRQIPFKRMEDTPKTVWGLRAYFLRVFDKHFAHGYNPLRNIPGGTKMAGTDIRSYYDFR